VVTAARLLPTDEPLPQGTADPSLTRIKKLQQVLTRRCEYAHLERCAKKLNRQEQARLRLTMAAGAGDYLAAVPSHHLGCVLTSQEFAIANARRCGLDVVACAAEKLRCRVCVERRLKTTASAPSEAEEEADVDENDDDYDVDADLTQPVSSLSLSSPSCNNTINGKKKKKAKKKKKKTRKKAVATTIISRDGEHAIRSCAYGGDRQLRHDCHKFIVGQALQQIGYSVEYEVMLLGSEDGRRLDIVARSRGSRASGVVAGGKDLAIDVGFVSGGATNTDLSAIATHEPTYIMQRCAAKKDNKYKEDVEQLNGGQYKFVPLICNTFGGWDGDAHGFLAALGNELSEKMGLKRTSVHLFRRLSVSAQRMNSRAVLRRYPCSGQDTPLMEAMRYQDERCGHGRLPSIA
jgi:hypothetical protein